MTAGQAVNQLAAEYAGQPILFLEQNYTESFGSRLWRFWDAFDGSSAWYPMVMVSSGQQVADGSVNSGGTSLYDHYKSMVEVDRSRPPEASIDAYQQRVGDRLVVTAWITNQSSTSLGYANSAAVSLLVYEDSRVLHTDRFVRAAPYASVSSELPPGETSAFRLETEPLAGVAWDRLHTVVLIDYRPPGSDAYDMFQAAFVHPATLTVTPDRLTFFVDETGNPVSGPIQIQLRGSYDNWEVIAKPDWIALPAESGTFADVPVVSLANISFPAGWQRGDLQLLVTTPTGTTTTVQLSVTVYRGTVFRSYLPAVD